MSADRTRRNASFRISAQNWLHSMFANSQEMFRIHHSIPFGAFARSIRHRVWCEDETNTRDDRIAMHRSTNKTTCFAINKITTTDVKDAESEC